MPFRVGARVVYPGYGAGTIVSIEDKVFAGSTTRYYILDMVASEGEFMVPVDQAEALGIRPVLDSDAIVQVLGTTPEELSGDYKERQAGITTLLASSDATQIGWGVRDLAWLAGSKQLTGRDVQLYEELQTQLASELSLAQGVSLDEARERLGQILAAITERAEHQAASDAG